MRPGAEPEAAPSMMRRKVTTAYRVMAILGAWHSSVGDRRRALPSLVARIVMDERLHDCLPWWWLPVGECGRHPADGLQPPGNRGRGNRAEGPYRVGRRTFANHFSGEEVAASHPSLRPHLLEVQTQIWEIARRPCRRAPSTASARSLPAAPAPRESRRSRASHSRRCTRRSAGTRRSASASRCSCSCSPWVRSGLRGLRS